MKVQKPTTPNLFDAAFVGKFSFLILLSLAVTAIMILYLDTLPNNVQVGNIATRDIKADQNYELVDTNSTDKLRDEAANNVLPVYDYDGNLARVRTQKTHEGFAVARESLTVAKTQGHDLLHDDETRLRQDFQIALGVALTDADYALIRSSLFSEDLEQALVTLIEPVEMRPIITDKIELLGRGSQGVVLRTSTGATSEVSEVNLVDYSHVLSLKEAQTLYLDKSSVTLQKQLNLDFLNLGDVKTALNLFPQFIVANVTYDKTETDTRRERARGNIQNIITKLQKGQIIIQRGERYEPSQISKIEGIRNMHLRTNINVRFAGMFILAFITIMALYVYTATHVRKFRPALKDVYFSGLMLVGFLLFLRLASFVSTSMKDSLWFTADITTFYYLIPMSAGAMMVRYILDAESALVFNVLLSFFAGIFLENNLEITLYYLISGTMAAHLIAHIERRSSVFRCGFYLGLINIALVICLNLLGKIATATTVDFEALAANCMFGFFGGLLSSLVLLAFSPIVETLFNYTTNIQLIELANMNHPLLREMIVRAPGTYHHSQLVGILAEAGARAVDGNPLLARVGSYYHDIGKMKKPQYFIENQKGDNPHDRLTPTMSALIIEAHVADGIEMAREYKLPKLITDFIPEHQGTKLIGYFFNKAKKMADPNLGKIEERDFRYKGPRPQSRESGIVMLADTIEAAVRSMPDKSPQKLQANVEKLVNMHFVDGQLDECDLTLRDLHSIVIAFTKILIGIYHQRVEYPETQHQSPIKIVKDESYENSDRSHLQPAPAPDNVAPLFKEKH